MTEQNIKVTALLHQNSRTATYAARTAEGERVTLRTARELGAAEAASLVRHEHDIMRQLGLPAEDRDGASAGMTTALVLVSGELVGEPLANSLATELDLGTVLWIGEGLARRLAHIHRNGVDAMKDTSKDIILYFQVICASMMLLRK